MANRATQTVKIDSAFFVSYCSGIGRELYEDGAPYVLVIWFVFKYNPNIKLTNEGAKM